MKHRAVQLLCLAACISVTCGRIPQKIRGGENASTGEFPYSVSVQEWGWHICGGSILDPVHILTAAHCVCKRSTEQIKVVTGAIDDDRGNKFDVAEFNCHPTYTPDAEHGWKDDIAILTLSSNITINEYQKPVNLPISDVPDGVSVVTSGWGALYATGPASRYLKKLSLTTVSLKDCQKAHFAPLNDGQFCASAAAGNNTCEYDSGNPVVHNGEIVGVNSWGKPCGNPSPEVYTKVYHYLEWIRRIINSN